MQFLIKASKLGFWILDLSVFISPKNLTVDSYSSTPLLLYLFLLSLFLPWLTGNSNINLITKNYSNFRSLKVKVTQSCLTLCDPMDCTVCGIPRTLEWVTCPFSSGSSWLRSWTGVSCIASRFFTSWATREVLWSIQWSILGPLYWKLGVLATGPSGKSQS